MTPARTRKSLLPPPLLRFQERAKEQSSVLVALKGRIGV